MTPYRGWMAWHHIAGLVGGIFVLTWIFSGWLSLNPGDYFASRGVSREMMARYRGQEAPDVAGQFPPSSQSAAVEVRFSWLGGHPLMVLVNRDGHESTADPATGSPVAVSDDQIASAASLLLPNATMILRQRIEQSDAYWYSHHQERPVPVLRVGFDDAGQTWFHIDPRTGDILTNVMSSSTSAESWVPNT